MKIMEMYRRKKGETFLHYTSYVTCPSNPVDPVTLEAACKTETTLRQRAVFVPVPVVLQANRPVLYVMLRSSLM